jgi:hypothetical protein
MTVSLVCSSRQVPRRASARGAPARRALSGAQERVPPCVRRSRGSRAPMQAVSAADRRLIGCAGAASSVCGLRPLRTNAVG